jgi:RHS repeat-associated protein
MQNLSTSIHKKPSSHFGAISNICTKNKKSHLKSDTGAYLFSFNGKEKIDEINGAGNDLDFGARIYDGRLGRWLSVDARFAKYPDLSPYTFSENNPLTMVDIGGDSTIYYTSRNNIIWISHDGLANAIVVIDDNQLIRFRQNVNTFKSLKVGDGKLANEHLRKMGKVFLIKPMEDTWAKFEKSNPLIEPIIDGRIFTGYLKDGVLHKTFYGEVKFNLIKNGNTFTVGEKSNPGGVIGSSDPKSEPNSCGTLHLHTQPRGKYIGFIKGGGERTLNFGNGPSNLDDESANNKGTYEVAMDPEKIYIYKGDNSNGAIFDRSKRFEKR